LDFYLSPEKTTKNEKSNPESVLPQKHEYSVKRPVQDLKRPVQLKEMLREEILDEFGAKQRQWRRKNKQVRREAGKPKETVELEKQQNGPLSQMKIAFDDSLCLQIFIKSVFVAYIYFFLFLSLNPEYGLNQKHATYLFWSILRRSE
jgi:hypothetical protein